MIPRPGHRLAQRIRASGVRGADKPGQLRPRGGPDPVAGARCRCVGGGFVIAATAPETLAGPRGLAAP